MTTALPYRRQQVTPRSGGRSAGDRRAAMDREYGSGAPVTVGNTALAPQSDSEAAANRPTLPRLRVAPPAPVSVPKAPFVAGVLAVVVAGVVGILVLNTKINENAFRLEALQKQQGRLDRTEAQLTQDLAEKESPTSLAAAARRLGLVPADSPAFITLPDGKVLTVPRPAAGQSSAAGTSTQKNSGATAGQPRR
ncbi:hypothetical protein HC028_01625 [Planosporangium flavigriseum]|uniref:Cell division protein FtsL n=1 Tax=Planosporangium flavigriseum TaxID=373681 RepID=A0A8J3LR83_9ACTN|nr:hypothetical protein [Planosporangium flavigriseum]NJC63216.1 hypothetical protein [Planosporangium flavigriseum]GIG72489.1 hypothetical protein Pfl04_08930 [Planosporangium flavigriseum]